MEGHYMNSFDQKLLDEPFEILYNLIFYNTQIKYNWVKIALLCNKPLK